MIIAIEIKARAVVPDGLYLPRFALDKNLDLPLGYMVGQPPPHGALWFPTIVPAVLTIQSTITEEPS